MKTPEEFWARTLPDSAGCWIWQGCTAKGYGELSWKGEHKTAHVIAYQISRGEIPVGLVVRHNCDNPICVNPAHLILGSHQDNILDTVSRKRHAKMLQTHCVNGHEFTAENTGKGNHSSRRCRTCHRQRNRALYAKKHASPGA